MATVTAMGSIVTWPWLRILAGPDKTSEQFAQISELL